MPVILTAAHDTVLAALVAELLGVPEAEAAQLLDDLEAAGCDHRPDCGGLRPAFVTEGGRLQ